MGWVLTLQNPKFESSDTYSRKQYFDQTLGKQRLRRVTLPDGTLIMYGYDYQNHRVSKTVTKGGQVETRTYLYHGNQVLEETLNGQRLNLYGWGASDLTSRTDASGHSQFYLNDGLGSVMAIIDEKANIVQNYEYSAFGECLSGKDAVNAFRFIGGFGGQTDDDTGLVYFWNRWYDPKVGRWVSEDPIRWESDNANMFGYVQNNPATLTDATGLKLDYIQVANIVFNEIGRLTGAGIEAAYRHVASAIWNGDERADKGGPKRPKTGPSNATVSGQESKYWIMTYQAAVDAYFNRLGDSCNGPFHFNLRGDSRLTPFFGVRLFTQDGPFDNPYTGGGLPSHGVYVNTYK